MIQQVDGANTTPYERPGRIEEVEGEAEVENDDGGWVLVETQRKTRERGQVVQEEKKTEVAGILLRPCVRPGGMQSLM